MRVSTIVLVLTLNVRVNGIRLLLWTILSGCGLIVLLQRALLSIELRFGKRPIAVVTLVSCTLCRQV